MKRLEQHKSVGKVQFSTRQWLIPLMKMTSHEMCRGEKDVREGGCRTVTAPRTRRAVRRLVLAQSQQSTAVPAPTPIDAADNPGFEDDTETVDGVSVGGE